MKALLLVAAVLAARPAHALSPAAETTLDQGLFALYDLDYEEARDRFRELITREPDNPYGYLFEAGSIWWQSSNEYGLFRDTPALEGVFEKDVERAIETSDRLFDAPDPRLRAEARFAAGMALGTRGQWQLMRGNWLRAYFDGKKAIKHLNKCVALDPQFYDAYLGLGIYDYQAARLPGILKLGALVGVRGDEERGIQRLKLALERGRFGARQAAQFLATVYLTDRKAYDQALPLIERLRRSFPTSPYFHFLEVLTLQRLGRFDDAAASARALVEAARQDPALLGRKQLSLLCGLAGPECLESARVGAAVDWFSRALAGAPADAASWRSLLHLYRGVGRDVLGQRAAAMEDYGRVLELPDFAGSQERARRCLAAPCTREQVVAMLKSLTVPAPTPIADAPRP